MGFRADTLLGISDVSCDWQLMSGENYLDSGLISAYMNMHINYLIQFQMLCIGPAQRIDSECCAGNQASTRSVQVHQTSLSAAACSRRLQRFKDKGALEK